MKIATPKHQSQLDVTGTHPPRPHPPDVMETAQLVARCTAAATAALLASNGADWVRSDAHCTFTHIHFGPLLRGYLGPIVCLLKF